MGFGWPLLRRSGLGIGSRSLELDWPPCSAAWTGLSKTALSPCPWRQTTPGMLVPGSKQQPQSS